MRRQGWVAGGVLAAVVGGGVAEAQLQRRALPVQRAESNSGVPGVLDGPCVAEGASLELYPAVPVTDGQGVPSGAQIMLLNAGDEALSVTIFSGWGWTITVAPHTVQAVGIDVFWPLGKTTPHSAPVTVEWQVGKYGGASTITTGSGVLGPRVKCRV